MPHKLPQDDDDLQNDDSDYLLANKKINYE